MNTIFAKLLCPYINKLTFTLMFLSKTTYSAFIHLYTFYQYLFSLEIEQKMLQVHFHHTGRLLNNSNETKHKASVSITECLYMCLFIIVCD